MFRVWVWVWGIWMAGSLVGFFVTEPMYLLAVLLGLCLTIALLVRPAYWQLRIRIVLIICLCASCCYSAWAAHHNTSNYSEIRDGKTLPFQGYIRSQPMIDGNQILFRLALQQETVQMTVVASTEQSLSILASHLHRGQTLAGSGTWRLPMEARNVGLFDYRAWLNQQHVFWTVRVEEQNLNISPYQKRSLLTSGDEIREKVAAMFEDRYEHRFAGFLSGMLLGAREKVDADDAASFSAIGLGHLLAISGLHVTVIVASWLWLMRQFKMMRVLRYALTYGLLGFFVVVTGASLPVLRAALMGAISLWFAYHRRWRDALTLLAVTGLLMLIWEPYWLLNVSYQLSFVVTFGLIAGVQAVLNRMPAKWPLWLRAALAVTLVAQMVSFPLTIYYFNACSLFAPLANLIFVPFVTYVITPLGYASLVIPLAWLVEPFLRWMFHVIEWLNAFQFPRLIWATPSWSWIALYGVMLVALLYPHGRKWVSRAAVFSLAVLLIFAYLPPKPERIPYMQAIDVGQGDAILLHMTNGTYWLMDAGGVVDLSDASEKWKQKTNPFDPGADLVLPTLMRKGIHQLDTIVMSHANEDHVLGLLAVIKRMPVKQILFNGTINGSQKIKIVYQEALKRGIEMREVALGDRFDVGKNSEVVILNPQTKAKKFYDTNQNERSLVLYVRMNQTSLLLTGDLDMDTEPKVLQAAKSRGLLNQPLTVLKVGHHGSRYASTAAFLAMWRPQVAIVSVGTMNRYGHPHPDTLRRLQHVGARIFRTDQLGGICLEILNKKTRIKTSLPHIYIN